MAANVIINIKLPVVIFIYNSIKSIIVIPKYFKIGIIIEATDSSYFSLTINIITDLLFKYSQLSLLINILLNYEFDILIIKAFNI